MGSLFKAKCFRRIDSKFKREFREYNISLNNNNIKYDNIRILIFFSLIPMIASLISGEIKLFKFDENLSRLSHGNFILKLTWNYNAKNLSNKISFIHGNFVSHGKMKSIPRLTLDFKERQSGLVVSKLDSRLQGCGFESRFILNTRWIWGKSHARINSCTQF